MRYGLLLFTILISFHYSIGQNKCSHKHFRLPMAPKASMERSDTIDILNYSISLDLTNSSFQTITANCKIDFVSKIDAVNSLSLDLLKLQVDSVVGNNQQLTFNYNDTLLVVNLPTTLNQEDTSDVTVYYQGDPQGDPSGWGGWYWQGNYAYNLGVGFDANPHNYGRVWHPCFDNFVERATYDFHILTNEGKKAYANGLMVSEQLVGVDSVLRSWRMDEPIPTYLACVASADYTHVEQTFTSQLTSNNIPMYLIARPTDTNNFKSSFVNLANNMIGFESAYGPYLWSKVGFHLVPFNAGAMEHATSIAYPLSSANGSLSSETLMAHELSHHWWGNLVTCRTAEDMWINEGFASYSERIFLEHQYGYQSYIDDIKANHKNVLHHAHIDDGGFYAISGVPHNITYGTHTYDKGADVAHTLRGYLGDSLFFVGLQSFLAANTFKDVDAFDFMNHLNSIQGVDVTDFFNDWIFNPGFPHFSIDSMAVTNSGGNYNVELYVRQKLRSAPNYYSNVPMEVTFKAADWSEEIRSFVISGQTGVYNFTLPFEPKLAFLNPNDKISQAVTAENVVLTSTGIKNVDFPFIRLNVSSLSDSVYLRMEHNWVAPDDFQEPTNDFMYHISEDRSWRITGLIEGTMDASIRFMFEGKNNYSGGLDTNITKYSGFHEDSLVLFFRTSPAEKWSIFEDVVFNTLGSATDGYARVDCGHLEFGEYAFGWKKSTVSIEELKKEKYFEVFPNPVSDVLNIDLSSLYVSNYLVRICDLSGKIIFEEQSSTSQRFIDVSAYPTGTYLVSVLENGKFVGSQQFIKD